MDVSQPAANWLRLPANSCSLTCVAELHTLLPKLRNAITIFHHLCRACESTDKPWLPYYYFQSDRQTNIFCNADFHSIRLWKTAWKLSELDWNSFSSPCLHLQNTLYTIRLQRDPILKCLNPCSFLHNEEVCLAFCRAQMKVKILICIVENGPYGQLQLWKKRSYCFAGLKRSRKFGYEPFVHLKM